MQEQFFIDINNPVLKNHMAYGQVLLPGLAYIDMLYQIFREHGHDFDKLELRNLSIYNPLIAGADHGVMLRVECLESQKGQWKIRVAGREQHNGTLATNEKQYITAEMYQTDSVLFQETLAMNPIRQPVGAYVDIEKIYEQCRYQDLIHTGFMKVDGKVYEADAATLIDISIGPEAQPSASDYMFHPALLDGSGVGSGKLLSSLIKDEQRLFLPLFCESFRASALVQSQCVTRIQTSSVQRKKELIYQTMEFFNESGQKVGELKNFINKLVRGAGLINPNRIRDRQPEVASLTVPPVFGDNRRSSGEFKTRPILSSSTEAEFFLRQLMAQRLDKSVDQIPTQADYYELGLDSPSLLEIVHAIETKIEATLSPTLMFEHTTIADLAGYLSDTYPDKFGQATAETIVQNSNVTAAVSQPPTVSSNWRTATGLKNQEEIAIIGVVGRYPKAKNIEAFWENLQSGKDCISEIPKERWDHRLYFDADKNKPGKTNCKWGGFLEDVDKFDPLFFNITPREAEIMDPKERLFLETVWELLESAGYTRAALQQLYQSRVGLYVGAMYQQYHSFDSDFIKESIISVSSYSSIANRASHFFNFQGPSVAIDTMCSSAIISIHMACESLRKGECEIAVAGGVNLTIHPKKYIGLSLIQLIGSHNNCRSFGDGDGYLPGEGVGAVLLKPLSRAIQDRDSILAVIKSTAMNHGGRTVGYTVPNPKAQTQLIEDNFVKCGMDPRTISYVESAANGTALADPIEIAALNKAFRKFTSDKQFCAIGSVKSNIGHAEAASGMSQLTKVILQMQHQQLVPSIMAKPLNPNIQFDNTPFYLQEELQVWKRPIIEIQGKKQEFPRRAAISSFAAGKSNAHLILEEYIPLQEEAAHLPSTITPQIVILSAKNQDRLRAAVEQILKFLESGKTIRLSDLAYTLQVGREAMECRVAMVVNRREELIQALKAYRQSIEEGKGKAIELSIPIFSGELEADNAVNRQMLSGQTSDAATQALWSDHNLEKLALHWTQGGPVQWELLHPKDDVRRIALPTYPFESRRCWIDFQSDPKSHPKVHFFKGSAEKLDIPHHERIIRIICGLLGMTPEEINLNKPLDQYGFDSILLMQLIQQLQVYIDPLISLDKLQESKTIQDIIHVTQTQEGKEPALGQQANSAMSLARYQFPELILMNQVLNGRPVFWFHGGLGGVEMYQPVARKCQRSFYGIQARGWMTKRSPLHGIQAMAAYYIHIMQSVQPEGPYDLGGYSLGGMLAYEITRQLQELGQVVDTIVMLDTMSGPEIRKSKVIDKTAMLQATNMALVSTIGQAPEKMSQILIHREEVDTKAEDEQFLKQLITLAKKRGMVKTEKQLYALIQQSSKVQQSYDVEHYSVLPLSDPNMVTCYYFRNKSGLFFGELEPFFTTRANELGLDHTHYWTEWEQQLPNFHMTDIDSCNHLMLLSEPRNAEKIVTFCEALYSDKKVSTELLESFEHMDPTKEHAAEALEKAG